MSTQVCDCLTEVIAMKGVCESRADCTVYLNEISIGVTVKMLELLTTDEHPTSAAVLSSVIADSAPNYVDRIKRAASEKIKERSIISTIDTARWRTPHTAIPSEVNTLRGIMIYLDNSQYLYSSIARVELFSDGSGVANESVDVYDLDSGELLASYVFDNSIAGFKVININTRFVGVRRLAVLYNAETVITNEVDEFGFSHYGELCESCGCGGMTWSTCVEFDSTQPIVYSNRLTTSANNCGMKICYSVGCSIEPYICCNLPYFANGFRNLVAMKIFKLAAISERINSATLSTESLKLKHDTVADDLDIFLEDFSKTFDPECKYCFPCADEQTQIINFLP